MDLVTISDMQAGLFTNWFIFHDPFTFCIFWVYFACALASVNRAPFDLAEAESELVAGFHTEYSGLRWSYFFMAEYGSMFAVSGLAAILFFGGWNGPIPLTHWIGWAYEPGETAFRLTGYLANFLGMLNFLFKVVVGVTVMMWVRWTLPRLRIDQVMTMCLKYCVPISAFMFLGASIWSLWDPYFVNDLAPLRPVSEVREGWLAIANASSTTGESPQTTETRPATTAARTAPNGNAPGSVMTFAESVEFASKFAEAASREGI
jgi:NADH-quinone oxidoreductase subunit H